MRDFWISFNEKYQKNKAVIWFVVVAVGLFILVTRNINKNTKSNRGSSVNSTTSASVSQSSRAIINTIVEENDNLEKISERAKEEKIHGADAIYLFVEICNSGKIDLAYEALSDECKEILFPSKQTFIDNYYGVIFKTSKQVEITGFKNDTYRVKFKENSIETGDKPNSGIDDYITIDENGKFNINGFIKRKNYNITSIAPKYTIYVESADIYTDHIDYKIKFKNNIKADIYINDVDKSNLCIKDYNKNVYNIDASDLFDDDYLVPAESAKRMKLRFNVNYTNSNGINEIDFNNIKIVNKEYYDSTSKIVDPKTGQTIYEKKKTNYPENDSWKINFEE